MNAYPLRNVPSELWTKAKHIAIDKKITLRELIINALTEYVKKNKKGK